MRICRNEIVLYIRPVFWLLLSFCLLTIPIKFIAAWLLAAGFHELCHITVLHLCRVRIYCIKIGFTGAEIETEPLSNRTEFYSALAGPFGSIALILLRRYFPTIAFFAFVQAVSNTLPVGNRDGSRILRCLFVKCFGSVRGLKILGCISTGIRWLIAFIFFYICMMLKFVLPMLVVMLFYLIKIPCKAGKQIVQYKHLKG